MLPSQAPVHVHDLARAVCLPVQALGRQQGRKVVLVRIAIAPPMAALEFQHLYKRLLSEPTAVRYKQDPLLMPDLNAHQDYMPMRLLGPKLKLKPEHDLFIGSACAEPRCNN